MANYEEIKNLKLSTYNSYVSYQYYHDIYCGSILTSENADQFLRDASMDIDTLTFNRIVGKGVNNLTVFQQNIVREVICQFAEFKDENKDILDSLINSYSIADVSIDFSNSQNITKINGVIIPTTLYNRLRQTGLTTRNSRY